MSRARIIFSLLFVFFLFYTIARYLAMGETSHDIYTILENYLDNTKDQVLVEPLEEKRALTFRLSECGCTRTMLVTHSSLPVLYNLTTCGQDAYRRGYHQNVVAFSFYGEPGSNVKYLKFVDGIAANARNLAAKFPGWVMRLYYDLSEDNPVRDDLCKLACEENNIDLCNAKNLPGLPMSDATDVFPMNWRFFPTLDPQVSLLMSRDLDSLASDREVAAVTEWLRSSRSFHVMRDHPQHGTEILGGTWAYRASADGRRSWLDTWRNILKDSSAWGGKDKVWRDQEILTKYVWPWVRKDTLSHDSYLCEKYPGPEKRAFPTQRRDEDNNFVGAVVNHPEQGKIWQECPETCRPPEHKNWTYC